MKSGSTERLLCEPGLARVNRAVASVYKTQLWHACSEVLRVQWGFSTPSQQAFADISSGVTQPWCSVVYMERRPALHCVHAVAGGSVRPWSTLTPHVNMHLSICGARTIVLFVVTNCRCLSCPCVHFGSRALTAVLAQGVETALRL